MSDEITFESITNKFYRGEFQLGQKLINLLLQKDLNNYQKSVLYSNLGLFESQLGNDNEAISDLNISLKLNHLNYIAYFNLFSLYIRNNEEEEAYNNLLCSMSSLYLLKANHTKNIDDVDKAIGLASNNVEAFLLKSLLYCNIEDYVEALIQINQARIIDPNNQILKNIEKNIFNKTFPKHSEADQTIFFQEKQKNKPAHQGSFSRLKGTFVSSSNHQIDPDQTDQDIQELIQRRLIEFNEVYLFVNQELGAITQKVPKTSLISNNIETFMIKNTNKQNNSEVQKKQQNKISINADIADTPSNIEKQLNILIQEKIELNTLQKDSSEQKVDEQNNDNQFTSVIEEPLQKYEYENQMEQCNLIYPRDESSLLKIIIQRVNIFRKQSSEMQRLKGVYCILNYNVKDGGKKIKTCLKECLEGSCEWNEEYSNIEISSQPSDMRVKIYNKNHSAVRDDLIGEIQILLTTADFLKLPIYNKKGQQAGELFIQLELIERCQQKSKQTHETSEVNQVVQV